ARRVAIGNASRRRHDDNDGKQQPGEQRSHELQHAATLAHGFGEITSACREPEGRNHRRRRTPTACHLTSGFAMTARNLGDDDR
ncbi:MAG: hypothetical protein HC900_02445, partial [Methylacidiphilales bacterium]|nr:hypothetical protein [Candidatus Methylacidiphilales bacterium]